MSSKIDAQKAQAYIDYFNDTIGEDNPNTFYSQWIDLATMKAIVQNNPNVDGFQVFFARYDPEVTDSNPNYAANKGTFIIAPTITNDSGVRENLTTELVDYGKKCDGCPNDKVYP